MSVAEAHAALSAALARVPFQPFEIVTDDARRIRVERADQAVLNSLAISVVEAAFSVTVIGLPQVREITPFP